MLWALIACRSFETCITTMGVDPVAVRDILAAHLDALARSGWLSFQTPVATYETALCRALDMSMGAERFELTAPMLGAHLFTSTNVDHDLP